MSITDINKIEDETCKLLDDLGLCSKNVSEFTFTHKAREMPTVTVTYFVEDVGRFSTFMQTFEVTNKEAASDIFNTINQVKKESNL